MNRSYAKDKRFTLRDCGEILSAVLYRSEDVVPTSVFEKTDLPVETSDGAVETVLPPHSIAQIRMRTERFPTPLTLHKEFAILCSDSLPRERTPQYKWMTSRALPPRRHGRD